MRVLRGIVGKRQMNRRRALDYQESIRDQGIPKHIDHTKYSGIHNLDFPYLHLSTLQLGSGKHPTVHGSFLDLS
jgi:hypothetical protein